MNKDYINSQIRIFADELKIIEGYFNLLKDDINAKCDLLEKEADKIWSNSDPDFTDPASVWAEANKAIIGTVNFPLAFHLTSITGGFCIIIYHSFDRFLEEFFAQFNGPSLDYLKIYNSRTSEVDLGNKLDKFGDFIKVFPEVKDMSCYKKINELRLVCNVFKHGTGGSMNDLREERPDMLLWPSGFGHENIRPFAGIDIDIKEIDFPDYLKALNLFLEEVLEYPN